MNYLLWQRQGPQRLGSSGRVIPAADVPLLNGALALLERLDEVEQQALMQVEARRESAWDEGWQSGMAEGRRQAADESAQCMAGLVRAAQVEHDNFRRDLAALALCVARRLLGQLADEQQLVALATTAAAELAPSSRWMLRVHPAREVAVRARVATLGLQDCEVGSDSACDWDACCIETAFGRIDASLDTQLKRLAQAWGLPTSEPPSRALGEAQ